MVCPREKKVEKTLPGTKCDAELTVIAADEYLRISEYNIGSAEGPTGCH
jgi:hypothetical protein